MVTKQFAAFVKELMSKCSNTSHLLSHLKNRYPLKFVEIRQAKNVEKPTTSCSCGQILIDVALSKGEKYCRSLKQWELLTDLVTHLSFVDCWTLSIPANPQVFVKVPIPLLYAGLATLYYLTK